MSGKVKVRCARCGRQFKSAGVRQTLCSDCEIKERQARAASKAQGPKPVAAVAPAPPPKIVGPGASILVPGMAPATPPVEAERVVFGAAAVQAEQHDKHRPPTAAGQAAQASQAAHSTSPTQPSQEKPERHDKHERHEKHDKQERQGAHAQPQRQSKAASQPKQRKPPTPLFVLTDDLRTQIEQRYLELAQPVEFDGIRTRIAEELSIPKAAVKRVVQEVRASKQMPSWWELQAFSGNEEDLARIRAAYEPLLPVPPVGVHKQIAASLGLEPVVIYHGIRRIRAEMRLPQYNPPELHEGHGTPQEKTDTSSIAATDQSTVQTTAS